MRRHPLRVLVSVIALVAASAPWFFVPLQATTVTGGPSLPRGAEMVPGVRAQFPDGQYLEFVGIVEDSRCPADAVCVWQGRAVVEFELAGEQILVTFIGGESVADAVVGYLVIVEDVQPYPKASQPISPEDYRVTISVEAR